MITVYCDDSSHAERRWYCMSFRNTPTGNWVGLPCDTEGRRLPPSGSTTVFLDGDRYLDPAGRGDENPVVRAHYRLRCKICKTTRPYREDTLWPVLNKLAAAGAVSISLKALAAIHSS